VLGSNNKLQQVFLNLFLNARDSMPSAEWLRFARVAQRLVEMKSLIQAPAFRAKNLHRIFDPFSQQNPWAAAPASAIGELRHHQGARRKSGRALNAGQRNIVPARIPVARKAVHV